MTTAQPQELHDNLVHIRTMIVAAYEKHQTKAATSDLENQIIDVLLMHPDALPYMTKAHILTQFDTYNPFFHIGLHLGLREQIATNRPKGILDIYAHLSQKFGFHEAEHAMIECLQHHLQKAQIEPNLTDIQYLEDLKKL